MTLYSGNKAYLCRRCFQEQQRAVEQALVTTNFLCFKSKRLALIFSPPEHNCVYEHPSALSSALYFPPAVSLLPCPHVLLLPILWSVYMHRLFSISHTACSPCSGMLTTPPTASQIPHSPYLKGTMLSICSLPVLLLSPPSCTLSQCPSQPPRLHTAPCLYSVNPSASEFCVLFPRIFCLLLFCTPPCPTPSLLPSLSILSSQGQGKSISSCPPCS